MLCIFSYLFLILSWNWSIKKKLASCHAHKIVNILFGLLLWLFETISPSFIVSIGKPLFPIAFSISFPVEMIILLAIEAVSIIINSVKLTHYLVKNK